MYSYKKKACSYKPQFSLTKAFCYSYVIIICTYICTGFQFQNKKNFKKSDWLFDKSLDELKKIYISIVLKVDFLKL